MPPRTKKRASATEEYESDGGFVAPESGDDAPKSKKAKTGKSSAPANLAGSKDAQDGQTVAGGGSVSANGEVFWELSDKRRVAVSEYAGKWMINIREYYEKDGKLLPGKKGISMPMAQFSTLVTLLPHIETVLTEKGEKIPRPDYDAQDPPGNEGGEGGEEPVGNGGSSRKKNFEETSEEET